MGFARLKTDISFEVGGWVQISFRKKLELENRPKIFIC